MAVPVDPVSLALVPVVLVVAPVAVPVVVVPEPEVAVAAQAEEPREPLVAAAGRASLVSRSGLSVKSLKCGRPRA